MSYVIYNSSASLKYCSLPWHLQYYEILLQVCETMRSNFSLMTIHQFGLLYKAFKIYSNDFVEDFLRQFTIKNDIKVNDPTWRSFFSEIVSRFRGARNHYCIFEFLKSVADAYLSSGRSTQFVFGLLDLNVPKLFAVTEEGNEEERKEDMDMAENFKAFLHNYIRVNALKHGITICMKRALVSCSLPIDILYKLAGCSNTLVDLLKFDTCRSL